MFYDFAITVSANTAKAAPTTQELKLTHGVIHRVEVEFPAGCAGLVHCGLLQGIHQLWPTNPDGSFASDDYVIAIYEDYELATEPYVVKFVGWNLDDTYDHTVTVRIGVLDSGPGRLVNRILVGLTKFLKLVGIPV